MKLIRKTVNGLDVFERIALPFTDIEIPRKISDLPTPLKECGESWDFEK